MRVILFDCFSGISGDMLIGALLDCGLKLDDLKRELAKLGISGYDLKKRKVRRGALRGVKFDIVEKKKITIPRTPEGIISLIKGSRLDKDTQEKAGAVFQCLVRAEAKVHGQNPQSVHFHELASLDTLLDIVGAIVGLKKLKIEKVFVSSINVGSGTLTCEHGTLPVPSPATLALLRGREISFSGVPKELVTPTGAALIKGLAEKGSPPPIKVQKTGYGAGSYNFSDRPNLLRATIGETSSDLEQDTVTVLETNIDDLTPLAYEELFEQLLDAGAKDVYLTAVQMKKSRPGTLLTVIFDTTLLDEISRIIFEETTTFGIRLYQAKRLKLSRQIRRIKTPYGTVRVNLGYLDGRIITSSPEYEDCRTLARRKKIPFLKVYQAAQIFS